MAAVPQPRPGGPRRLVLWLRNDLRLTDSAVFAEAVQAVRSKKYDDVVPLYCFDPRFFNASKWGAVKTGTHRARFLLECVTDLKRSLRGIGSDLVVSVGTPEEALTQLAVGTSVVDVLTQTEVTSEELSVDACVARTVRAWGGSLTKLWGSTMWHMEDVAGPGGKCALGPQGLRAMPDVYTPFKEKVEAMGRVRAELPRPKKGELPLPSPLPPPSEQQQQQPGGTATRAANSQQPDIQPLLRAFPGWGQLPWPAGHAPAPAVPHAHLVLPFVGGETNGLARLKYYLWESDCVATYFDTRNGMLGGDYSTKLAPWLSVGCVSPRTVYHEVMKYEAQRTANKSTYWVRWELTARDYFRFFALKHGNKIFHERGTTGKSLQWSGDPELFARWRDGQTGMPLVDANMREMNATGWMSNRGRQNVASYLVLDLGVDWRRGADYFESLLIDYDVASNWGNWVAMAGLTGGRINHFNVTKQAKDYDPDGVYLRTWLPELKNVPAPRIFEPWLMSRDDMKKYGVQIGVDYPVPISASNYGRPHGGPGAGRGQGGGGGGRGGGASSGRGGGGDRRGGLKSEFERYG